MSIGIVDADIAKYTLVCFNLECMKLSAYYKKRNQIVIMSPQVYADRHKKIFVRQDYNDGQFLPGLAEPNVESGGLAFSRNKYVPLDEAIEVMPPDTSIYNYWLQDLREYDHQDMDKIINDQINGEHLRLSLDGVSLWPKFEQQLRTPSAARSIIFHDYNVAAVPEALDIIHDLAKNSKYKEGPKFGMKFPLIISDDRSLLQWSNINPNSTFYGLTYRGIMKHEPFIEWVTRMRRQAIFTQMTYQILLPWEATPQYFTQFIIPELYRQVVISHSYRVRFSLTYDKAMAIDPRWFSVFDMMNFFLHGTQHWRWVDFNQRVNRYTMFDYARMCPKETEPYNPEETLNLTQMRANFAFVREVCPELFKGFYEWDANKMEEYL